MPKPSTGAAQPTAEAEDVISIFSDAYASIEGLNLNPGWGQATQVSQEAIANGDTILKYDLLNYQGTDFETNPQDLSIMGKLHVDVWSAQDESINIYLINKTTEGSEEKAVALDLTVGAWKSFDIALTDFTTQGMGIDAVFQLKVDGGDGSPVYFDNIYFYRENTALVKKEKTSAIVYPNPTNG